MTSKINQGMLNDFNPLLINYPRVSKLCEKIRQCGDNLLANEELFLSANDKDELSKIATKIKVFVNAIDQNKELKVVTDAISDIQLGMVNYSIRTCPTIREFALFCEAYKKKLEKKINWEQQIRQTYDHVVNQLEKRGIKLEPKEAISMQKAVEFLSLHPDEQEKLNQDWNRKKEYIEPMLDMEKGGFIRFALDENAFQIMRSDDSSVDRNWVRFGIERIRFRNIPRVFVEEEMVRQVNVAEAVPEVARKMNQLWDKGAPVIALLGAARIPENHGGELIDQVYYIVDAISTGANARPHAAYMTGGFRSAKDKRYGITRAGYDVPRRMGKETYVIMCEAGVYDSHKEATAKSIYGKQWGDDTPGLSSASDGAIIARNIPAGKGFGAWTSVEIANFVKQDKPVAILDPTIGTDSCEEIFFGKPVPVFKRAVDAAEYLKSHLPSEEEIKARPKMDVQPFHTFEMPLAIFSTQGYDYNTQSWFQITPELFPLRAENFIKRPETKEDYVLCNQTLILVKKKIDILKTAGYIPQEALFEESVHIFRKYVDKVSAVYEEDFDTLPEDIANQLKDADDISLLNYYKKLESLSSLSSSQSSVNLNEDNELEILD